ncbi:M20 family metallopeptidase [Chloroflexota bacterium]
MEWVEIAQKVQKLSPRIIDIRRKLHQNPELSEKEQITAAFIASHLCDIGIEVEKGVGGTGVVGLLHGKGDGRTIAVRADMDALPITETNDLSYKSVNDNCMHACGHDGHMAITLGLAELLVSLHDSFNGKIKFIFQPAEETPPEGGAKRMIADGVLQNPNVDAILGVHIWPDVIAGEIALKTGPIMAQADKFELIIRGKGGHGASPHHTVDSFVIAAQVILAFQTLVSRNIDPSKSVVLSIGKCSGGSAYNIIPKEVRLEGTTRYFEANLGTFIKERMEKLANGICQAYGGSYELIYQYGFPPTINDSQITKLLARSASEILGEEKVNWIEAPSMIGEDFSYFLQQVPGCYFLLGTKNPDRGIVNPLHSSNFQLDEDVLSLGTAIFAKTILNFLNM